MHTGVRVFSLGMRNMNLFPALQLIDVLDHGATAASKRDEFDTILGIEFGQLGIGGKLRIENQRGFHTAAYGFPERKKLNDLIVRFAAPDIRVGVKYQFGLTVLGKKRQGPLHALSTRAGPMSFQDRFFTKMRYRVKVQVDELPVIQTQPGCVLDERLLQVANVFFVQRV